MIEYSPLYGSNNDLQRRMVISDLYRMIVPRFPLDPNERAPAIFYELPFRPVQDIRSGVNLKFEHLKTPHTIVLMRLPEEHDGKILFQYLAMMSCDSVVSDRNKLKSMTLRIRPKTQPELLREYATDGKEIRYLKNAASLWELGHYRDMLYSAERFKKRFVMPPYAN